MVAKATCVQLVRIAGLLAKVISECSGAMIGSTKNLRLSLS